MTQNNMLFANVSTLGGRILNIVGITIYYEEKERQEKKKVYYWLELFLMNVTFLCKMSNRKII